MNTEALQINRQQSKQAITKAILENRFDDARNMINDAMEYQKMIGNKFVYITDLEINDFYQAIDESEITGK